MNTSTPTDTNGDAPASTSRSTGQATASEYPLRRTTSSRASALDLIYAGVDGFVIGFVVGGAGVLLLFYFIKVTGGIDGE